MSRELQTIHPSIPKAAHARTLRKTVLLLTIILVWACYSFAQTALPYYTGFDNAAEKSGWAISRYGSIGYSNWTIDAGSGPSAPNILSHDYPVGNPGTDTVEDWIYSPPFDFHNGGKLQSIKVNVFDIVGQANASDELSIFVVKKISSTSFMVVVKLADLTKLAANNTNWHDTGNFTIPPTTGTCYIAIKYKAVNDWFVPSIDNINIISNSNTGVGAVNTADALSIYPNPASTTLSIVLPAARGDAATINLIDATGRRVMQSQLHQGITTVDISKLAPGLYFVLEQFSDGTTATGKLNIQH